VISVVYRLAYFDSGLLLSRDWKHCLGSYIAPSRDKLSDSMKNILSFLGAIDAVNCAIELRNIFGKMKSNWIKLWHLHFGYDDMRIDLKCGINSGEVLFGRLGTDDRDEITVVGRVVNLASRLECRAS
jgi:class 3 adenylate cyclase